MNKYKVCVTVIRKKSNYEFTRIGSENVPPLEAMLHVVGDHFAEISRPKSPNERNKLTFLRIG